MVKPIYGLKDAQRAWRKRLHQVLSSCGTMGDTMKQLHAEGEIHTLHTYDRGTASKRYGMAKMQQLLDLDQAAKDEDVNLHKQLSEDKWLSSRRAVLHCI